MMTLRTFILVCLAILFSHVAQAALTPSEIPGGVDNPTVSRYTGSTLQNTADESFASVRVPQSPGTLGANGKLAFSKETTVEGHVQSYFYIGPKERSALEIFRNYQSALRSAGLTTLFQCEMNECAAARITEHHTEEAVRVRAWQPNRNGNPASSVDRDVRFISARGTRNGAEIFVMVYVAEPNSLWEAPATIVLVVEPKPLEDGKVLVDLAALKRSLTSEGKVALYGIYFDTGKATLKPESKAQLDEMAKLLTSDPKLKVFIVGHTDNQGAFDTNRELSKQRASAVTTALVQQYKIDGSRLRAEGVANLAPVASNADEAGRAKNRRVELVLQ